MLWAAFGGALLLQEGVAGTTQHPGSQGSQTPGGSTFPVWFQTLLFGVMLLHLAEQELIHQCEQSLRAAKPNLLPKPRRGEQIARRESRASSKAQGNQW